MRLVRSIAPAVVLAVAASGALAAPDLPIIPVATFTVPAATGNAATDTANLQATLTAAKNAGGGTVSVPAGTYLSNPLTISSNVNLFLSSGATVRNNSTAASLLTSSGSNLHDIQISGSGTLDGRATAASTARLVDIRNVTRLAVTGITLQNSSNFHLVVSNDNHLTIDNVKINDDFSRSSNGGQYLSNTDGIDYSGQHVLIQNCTINCGDDDIVAKPGSTFCSDIRIQNCTIGAGHGISVGGQTNSGLDGLTVANCTFTGTTNGLRLKAGRGQGGTVKNVLFAGITMTNVANPIIINSWYDTGDHYGSKELSSLTNSGTFNPNNPGDPAITVDQLGNATDLYPFYDNITYSHITATGATSNVAIIYGLNSSPAAGAGPQPLRNIDNVAFDAVNLSGNYGADLFYTSNLNLTGLTVNASRSNALYTFGSQLVVPEPASLLPALALVPLMRRRR